MYRDKAIDQAQQNSDHNLKKEIHRAFTTGQSSDADKSSTCQQDEEISKKPALNQFNRVRQFQYPQRHTARSPGQVEFHGKDRTTTNLPAQAPAGRKGSQLFKCLDSRTLNSASERQKWCSEGGRRWHLATTPAVQMDRKAVGVFFSSGLQLGTTTAALGT
ncbi:unnamed protein product [Calypogeia fissa]